MEKPFKELRFTRSRQAVTFVIAGVVFLAVAGGVLALWLWRVNHPLSLWWAVLPLTAAWACLRLAANLTRHAYLLLSPLGIEIFPFYRPAQNMQLFAWSEIQHAGVSEDGRLLTLTLAGYEDAKVIISLDPVKEKARPMLKKAVEGVMERRETASLTPPATDPSSSSESSDPGPALP